MVTQVADYHIQFFFSRKQEIYLERKEEKVDDLRIRLPHDNEWDDQQNGSQLEGEPTEYRSCQRVKDVEHDRAKQRANIFNGSNKCKQFSYKKQKITNFE